MKVGLVLEGGAMRGLFTAGVLDVFLDEQIHIDGIVGVSAGVLFGANFPSKQRGRSLRYNLKYLHDKRFMGWYSLLTTGNIVNKQFAFYDIPYQLDPFDGQAFIQSGIDFYATLTNVETGQAEYHIITDPFAQMETLRASASMPYVSKMVEIDGQKYLDGGIADSIPLQYCQTLGYDKIIVILTRSQYDQKKISSLQLSTFNWLFYRNYPQLAKTLHQHNELYHQSVNYVLTEQKQGNIFVIRPSQHLLIKRIEKDLNKIQSIYDLGVFDAKVQLQALKQYLSFP